MSDWFEGLGGPEFATAVVWTFAALILLVIVLVIIRLIRSLTFGTFVAGGRNRKTRLAVMDATAVDSHRRLVLVRRDDIEHLLLIGGPTDVVVEREIRLGQTRRNQSVFGTTETAFEAPAPAPLPPLPTAPRASAAACARAGTIAATARPGMARQQPPRPPERVPQPARQPERQTERQPIQPPPRVATRQTGARPPARDVPMRETSVAPGRPNNPSRGPATPYSATPYPATPPMTATALSPPQQTRSNSLDDALLRELEVTFDAGPPKKQAKPVEMTLDDEMTKLLGELSNHKR